MTVPNSSGTARPALAAPLLACDSHIHIYDARFPMPWPDRRGVDGATVAQYRLLQQRIGTSRVVVVQPAAYGTDNAVTVDAVRQLGIANARGVGVLHPDATDAELKRLHEGGIRGLRFTQHEPRTAVTTPEMIEPLARRVHALGWHVQLHLLAAQLVAMADMIERLPCTLVIDHRARLPAAEGIAHPAFEIVRRLLDRGRTWVKLSGPYLDSASGGPRYRDVAPAARALVMHAPERMVWGSDWPHPTEREAKPDDAALLDVLAEWAPDASTQRRILVDNPAALYGF